MKDETDFVLKSSYRIKVMKSLDEGIKMPLEIAGETGIDNSHISKILRDFGKWGIAECLNPKMRKGRLYRLTDKGRQVSAKVSLE